MVRGISFPHLANIHIHNTDIIVFISKYKRKIAITALHIVLFSPILICKTANATEKIPQGGGITILQTPDVMNTKHKNQTNGLHESNKHQDDFMKFVYPCKFGTASNSDYKKCRARLFEKQAAAISGETGVTCDTKRCLYKLAPKDGKWGNWAGEGYTLSFFSGNKAEEILGSNEFEEAAIITDPQQRISVFSSCGTCSDLKYVSGPIKQAAVVFISRQIELLAIPR